MVNTRVTGLDRYAPRNAAGQYLFPGHPDTSHLDHEIKLGDQFLDLKTIHEIISGLRKDTKKLQVIKEAQVLVPLYNTILEQMNHQADNWAPEWHQEVINHEQTHVLQQVRLGIHRLVYLAETICKNRLGSLETRLDFEKARTLAAALAETQAYQQELLRVLNVQAEFGQTYLPSTWLGSWRWLYLLQNTSYIFLKNEFNQNTIGYAVLLKPDVDEILSEGTDYLLSAEYKAELLTELGIVLRDPDRLLESASPRARLAVDQGLIQATDQLTQILQVAQTELAAQGFDVVV